MSAFIKSDLRQTVDYGASFNQYLFDILSKLVDKSNAQVGCALVRQLSNGCRMKGLSCIVQGEEVERLRTMMHEQGRDIDHLKQASNGWILMKNICINHQQENKDQKKRIEKLEALLDEEIRKRKEDHETLIVTIETEVQERIFHDRKLTVIVNTDREKNNDQLFNLRDDMVRENEMLR